MTPLEREAAILENVRAGLTAEGYDVILQPDRLSLPPFLQHLQPDAIASRHDENLVVEVVSRTPAANRKIERVKEALRSRPNWKLRTIWISGRDLPASLEKPSLEFVHSALTELDQLLAADFLRPALLVAWACLEGIGRVLLPDALQKPQTPGRLVEQLAENGYIDRTQAAELRQLVDFRNRFIHGVVQTEVRKADLTKFRDILWQLHETARVGEAA
jgi:uncharacterized protein YutE (UPF0331/DUF86 family)